jgi:hypothetical protein
MNRAADSRRDFTPKQGQYLAFIHAYTLVNGRPPAEADLMWFFRVTPPTVHQMVLGLEKAGLISRKPGVPRSIAVLLERSALPELNPRDAQPVKTTVTRYSHVRHFKLQAQKILACFLSISAWPPLRRAGGTIMKRRLIML